MSRNFFKHCATSSDLDESPGFSADKYLRGQMFVNVHVGSVGHLPSTEDTERS